jgi:hypothetical protein
MKTYSAVNLWTITLCKININLREMQFWPKINKVLPEDKAWYEMTKESFDKTVKLCCNIDLIHDYQCFCAIPPFITTFQAKGLVEIKFLAMSINSNKQK